MREDKFRIIQFVRDLILIIDKELANYPKKDIEIKNRIRTNTYDLLEFSYEANSAEDLEYKIKLTVKMIAKVKVIDFLLNLSYDKKLITEKKYYKLAQRIDDIAKFTTGWMRKLMAGRTTRQDTAIDVKLKGECEKENVAIFDIKGTKI